VGVTLPGGLELPERDVQFRFLRSPGPGGQNVNKVATACELRFNVAGCSLLDDETRRRFATLAGRRLAQDGWLVLDAHRHRSQERNRADALERLAELIRKAMHRPKPRRPTRPTQGAKRRRLAAKQGRGATKRLRGKPDLE
jgi:ribosome-associated protein